MTPTKALLATLEAKPSKEQDMTPDFRMLDALVVKLP